MSHIFEWDTYNDAQDLLRKQKGAHENAKLLKRMRAKGVAYNIAIKKREEKRKWKAKMEKEKIEEEILQQEFEQGLNKSVAVEEKHGPRKAIGMHIGLRKALEKFKSLALLELEKKPSQDWTRTRSLLVVSPTLEVLRLLNPRNP
jgi:hypothetical protein